MDLFEPNDIPRFFNDLVKKAIEEKASDIHLCPGHPCRVRYRIDGDLTDFLVYDIEKHPEIITRIKIMANLDIGERRLPQDGRISWEENIIDLRVAISPTQEGELAVIRVLNRASYEASLDELGFSKENLDRLKKIISKPSGMLISTGPTGCGKSTTLYALIQELNKENINIMTIEDPVEYLIKGVNQIQYNQKKGLVFGKALKAMLRSDPDVIMVGEIRDSDTAEIAIRASITGHLMLSTLHTTDAYSGLIRLLDMGIEPYLIASALSGIQSQRLIKKLCPHCSEPYEPDSAERNIIEKAFGENFTANFKKPLGCKYCRNGYQGRLAISEIFEVDDDFNKLIKNRADLKSLRDLGHQKGITTMLEDGILKASNGEIYLKDVIRASF